MEKNNHIDPECTPARDLDKQAEHGTSSIEELDNDFTKEAMKRAVQPQIDATK